MNDDGDIVFIGTDPAQGRQVYYYDGSTGTITQMTSGTFDYMNAHPLINGRGQLLWTGSRGIDWDYQEWRFMFDGTYVRVIRFPELVTLVNCIFGADDEVYCSTYTAIYHYDPAVGSSTVVVSPPNSARNLQVNVNGVMVWSAQDAPSSDLEIFRYEDATGIVQLTDDPAAERKSDYFPKINADGDITWWRNDVGFYKILLLDGTTGDPKQLNYNDGYNYDPEMNGAGDVVWRGNINSTTEIFFYSSATGVTTQLTDTPYFTNYDFKINDDGYIVWTGDGEVFLATPEPCEPEICDDGMDNDCDGAIDCADTDCTGSCLQPDPVPSLGPPGMLGLALLLIGIAAAGLRGRLRGRA